MMLLVAIVNVEKNSFSNEYYCKGGELPVDNRILGVKLETQYVHMQSACQFHFEKKAWEDKISDVTEDDKGPYE